MSIAGHSQEDLYRLLAQGREAVAYPAGQEIFQAGDDGDCLYIVSSGRVALKDGDRVVDTAKAPGLFGEMALIDSAPRALTAVAETDSQLVKIPVRHFWVLVHETPYFAQLVMSVMANRLRHTGETT